MREGKFIQRNKEKWAEIDKAARPDPDALADQFIELVDDLGYAKTFYPGSKLSKYLNTLASGKYLALYRNKSEEKSRIINFYKTEVPETAYKHRYKLLYAIIIFLGFCLIGGFSTAIEPEFTESILGPDYVEMTKRNIQNGDPFGVYKQDQIQMLFGIFYNNIRVAILAFVLGIFLSMGTAYVLMKNGIMLGSFQYFFFNEQLGWDSVLVIWIHGSIEIPSIVIAGAAGFILGNSLLFPGHLSRKDSLRSGAKDGLKLLAGVFPLFLIAAVLESYVTRLTNMPSLLSILILGSSLAGMIWYFGLYPLILQKKRKLHES